MATAECNFGRRNPLYRGVSSSTSTAATSHSATIRKQRVVQFLHRHLPARRGCSQIIRRPELHILHTDLAVNGD